MLSYQYQNSHVKDKMVFTLKGGPIYITASPYIVFELIAIDLFLNIPPLINLIRALIIYIRFGILAGLPKCYSTRGYFHEIFHAIRITIMTFN